MNYSTHRRARTSSAARLDTGWAQSANCRRGESTTTAVNSGVKRITLSELSKYITAISTG